MLFRSVQFTKYAINPDEIIRSLPQYKPACWPREWDIVCIKNGTIHDIQKWMMEYTTANYDMVAADEEVMVAFEDLTDSTLFKISYTEKNTI